MGSHRHALGLEEIEFHRKRLWYYNRKRDQCRRERFLIWDLQCYRTFYYHDAINTRQHNLSDKLMVGRSQRGKKGLEARFKPQSHTPSDLFPPTRPHLLKFLQLLKIVSPVETKLSTQEPMVTFHVTTNISEVTWAERKFLWKGGVSRLQRTIMGSEMSRWPDRAVDKKQTVPLSCILPLPRALLFSCVLPLPPRGWFWGKGGNWCLAHSDPKFVRQFIWIG